MKYKQGLNKGNEEDVDVNVKDIPTIVTEQGELLNKKNKDNF